MTMPRKWKTKFLDLIAKYDLDRDLLNWDNNIWHGVVGAYKIAEDFGLKDEEIFQAIQRHTIGAGQMTLLDKVLYVADYIEPNRNFPGGRGASYRKRVLGQGSSL